MVDEPLYGYYLAETGIAHPGRDEILRSMPTRWPEVVDHLTSGPLPPVSIGAAWPGCGTRS